MWIEGGIRRILSDTQIRVASTRLDPGRPIMAATMIGALLSGCSSSVLTRKLDADLPTDGIVYKLPKTRFVVQATYELACQKANGGAAALKVAEVTLAPRIVPDDSHAYVIDTRELSDLLTSVNPAKFELQNGMLKGVTYKETSEAGPILADAVKLAATIGINPFGGIGRGDDKGAPVVRCTNAFVSGELGRVAGLTKAVDDWTTRLAAADRRMQASPSEANEKAVSHAERRLAELKAARATAGTALLRRTVEFEIEPESVLKDRKERKEARDAARAAESSQASTASLDGCNLRIEERDLTGLSPLFAALERTAAPGGPLTQDDKARLSCLRVDSPVEESPKGASWKDPPRTGYQGIYYRRGVGGEVTVGQPSSGFHRRFPDVPILQFGPVSRLQIRNLLFENRGYTIGFDEKGQLITYEATSASAAKAAM